MNIDRSLDEIMRERRAARRKRVPGRRRRSRAGNVAGAGKVEEGGDVKMIDALTRGPKQGIRKQRRLKGSKKEVEVANGILNAAFDSFKSTQAPQATQGVKVHVGNLDLNVTNIDISELFSAVGPLKRALVVYDQNGRSTGTAEVVFAKMNDALEAIKKYNGIPLDGRPLDISLATEGAKFKSTQAPGRSFQQPGFTWDTKQSAPSKAAADPFLNNANPFPRGEKEQTASDPFASPPGNVGSQPNGKGKWRRKRSRRRNPRKTDAMTD